MDAWPWPPTLDYLLCWTQAKLPGRQAMGERFPPLLDAHKAYLPETLIKITGTNGKGSVCAMLEAALMADGQVVGLFTSPHLVRVTERIRVNGEEVGVAEIEAHALALKHEITQRVALLGEAALPSFFEIMILIALRVFARAAVTVAVFEAGIGGANDAVSLLPGRYAAITSVGLDHTDILGATLRDIALDKAGIASPRSALVAGPEIVGEVLATVREACERHAVELISCPADGLRVISHTLAGIRFTGGEWPGEGLLNLVGVHQIDNLAVVLRLLSLLERDHRLTAGVAARAGLGRVRWPCRLTSLGGDPWWLLDVAHNGHAIAALIRSLELLVPHADRVLLFGASRDKDYLSYLHRLPEIAPEIHLVAGFHRAATVERLSALLEKGDSVCGRFMSIEEALETLQSRYRGSGKVIIVAGSVFLSGAVHDHLKRPV